MKTPVIVEFRDGKFKILRKIVKKLEKDEVKEALARNGITPVDESLSC